MHIQDRKSLLVAVTSPTLRLDTQMKRPKSNSIALPARLETNAATTSATPRLHVNRLLQTAHQLLS
jgi:hypothetical protein